MAFDFFNISGALFVEKNTDSGYKIDLKNVDFVNANGELVGQSWDFTQRFFRLKNEESTIIKEYIDYFGDNYVK